jgi:hypothetical protein
MQLSVKRFKLSNWDYGQQISEYIAARYLVLNDYRDVVPQAPLGGGDGGKDICFKINGISGIAACYFPNASRPFKEIQKKFEFDFNKLSGNNQKIFIFITGQSLTASQREKLTSFSNTIEIRVFDVHALVLFYDELMGSLSSISDTNQPEPYNQKNTVHQNETISRKVLRKIISNCYFWIIPLGWRNHPKSFSAEILECQNLENYISTISFSLDDEVLQLTLSEFITSWTSLRFAIMEKYDLDFNGNSVSYNKTYSYWENEYLEKIKKLTLEFREKYEILIELINSKYPEMMYCHDLSNSSHKREWVLD